MLLNQLLLDDGIDPGDVVVLRHRPKELKLRRVMPWLVESNHELYNAYQQSQGPKVEQAMMKASFVVSLIGHEPGKALFIGIYSILGTKLLSFEEHLEHPLNKKLRDEYGMNQPRADRTSIVWFDLERTAYREDWRGKLIFDWPGGELSWWRWSERNKIPVRAILEESVLEQNMPHWTKLVVSWDELMILPRRWRDRLAEWRGVYFIYDSSDGKGYIGSAYGDENLLARWRNYSETSHGGNVMLRNRDPANFRFSILQRVSPDMDPTDVIRLEGAWKDRLHTRTCGLNAN